MIERAPGKSSCGLVPRMTRAWLYQGRPSIKPSRKRSRAISLSWTKSSVEVTRTRSNPSSRA